MEAVESNPSNGSASLSPLIFQAVDLSRSLADSLLAALKKLQPGSEAFRSVWDSVCMCKSLGGAGGSSRLLSTSAVDSPAEEVSLEVVPLEEDAPAVVAWQVASATLAFFLLGRCVKAILLPKWPGLV